MIHEIPTGKPPNTPSLLQQHEQLEILLKSVEAIIANRDFKEIISDLFHACKKFTGATTGYVTLLSPNGNENKVIFLDNGESAYFVDTDLSMPVRGLRAEAFYKKRAVFHNSFAQSPFVTLLPENHLKLDNVLFAPITIGDKVVGLLVFADKPTFFDENDAQIATLFGEIAAVALKNDKAVEEERTFNSKWSNTFNAIDEIIFISSPTMEILYMNQMGIEAFGGDLKNIVGNKCCQIVHGTDQPPAGCPGVKARKHLRKHSQKQQVGDQIYHSSAWPIVDEQKNLSGFTHVMRNITEAERAALNLRESEQRYRDLFNSMVDGFALHEIIVDDSGQPCNYRFLKVNPAFERLTNLKADDIIGRTVLEVTPQIEKQWIDTYGRVALTGEPIHFENYSAAMAKHYEVNAYRPAEGQFACVFTDVTERKRVTDELAQSERRFRSIVESSPMGAHFYSLGSDNRLRLTDYNSAADRILGIDHRPLVGKTLEEAFVDIDKTEILDVYVKVAKGEIDFQTIETVYREKQLSRQLEIHVFQTGENTIATNFLDISEKSRLSERLHQAEKMEAIGHLAGGVAHDFNNLLTSILGFAERIEARVENEQLKKYATNIVTASRRSADLTSQLLAYSRKGKYLSVAVDLHKIVNDVITLVEHTFDKKIEIRHFFNAASSSIEGDPSQLQNAILNLAINARDAMPEGGTITFETLEVEIDQKHGSCDLAPGKYIELRVMDTGIGMTQEVKKHLFEPFFTTKEPGKGTGLGLASIHGIVKNHSGVVRYKTKLGCGTCFMILLPLSQIKAREEPTSLQTKPAPYSLHILIIDDEVMICNLLFEILSEQGHQVSVFSSAEEAVAFYARDNSRKVDLVVLDINMPRMNGRECFEALRVINPKVKVLISSGYSQQGEVQKLLDRGVLGYLKKPFDEDMLMSKVSEVFIKTCPAN